MKYIPLGILITVIAFITGAASADAGKPKGADCSQPYSQWLAYQICIALVLPAMMGFIAGMLWREDKEKTS